MNARRTNRSLSHAERSLIILLLAAIGLALAFTQPAAAQQAESQVLAAQYIDALDGSNLLALVDPNAVLHTPEGEFTGAGAVNAFGATLDGSFSDLAFETRSVETVDDLLVIAFTMSGTHTGGYLGLQPNCAGIAVPGMAVLRTGDAGITEQWIDYDRRAVIDQIYAYSRFDAGLGTACTGVEPAAPSGPPTCLAANECQTPF